MKKDIHPENYRQVIFLDTTSGEKFLLSSAVETEETDTWEDGEEYPLARIEMSSASHPFYTGVEQVVDTAGRVEKFKARQQKAKKQSEEAKKKTASKKDDEADDKKDEKKAKSLEEAKKELEDKEEAES